MAEASGSAVASALPRISAFSSGSSRCTRTPMSSTSHLSTRTRPATPASCATSHSAGTHTSVPKPTGASGCSASHFRAHSFSLCRSPLLAAFCISILRPGRSFRPARLGPRAAAEAVAGGVGSDGPDHDPLALA